MQITVTVTGLDETKTGFDVLAAQLNDFTDAFIVLGEALAGVDGYFREAPFITQGDIFGERWRALKTSTIREKTRHAGSMMAGVSPSMPLVGTGKLRQGFKYAAGPMSLFIDNSVDYWKYHQTGTGEMGDGPVPGVGRGKNLPKRMTLGIDDIVESMIANTLQNAVDYKIKDSFSGS